MASMSFGLSALAIAILRIASSCRSVIPSAHVAAPAPFAFVAAPAPLVIEPAATSRGAAAAGDAAARPLPPRAPVPFDAGVGRDGCGDGELAGRDGGVPGGPGGLGGTPARPAR